MKKIIITDEILDKIHTDSDIMDFADELGVSYRELDLAISLKYAEGTPCEGCKNIVFYSSMPPCVNCSRCKKDYYERID